MCLRGFLIWISEIHRRWVKSALRQVKYLLRKCEMFAART